MLHLLETCVPCYRNEVPESITSGLRSRRTPPRDTGASSLFKPDWRAKGWEQSLTNQACRLDTWLCPGAGKRAGATSVSRRRGKVSIQSRVAIGAEQPRVPSLPCLRCDPSGFVGFAVSSAERWGILPLRISDLRFRVLSIRNLQSRLVPHHVCRGGFQTRPYGTQGCPT